MADNTNTDVMILDIILKLADKISNRNVAASEKIKDEAIKAKKAPVAAEEETPATAQEDTPAVENEPPAAA